MLSSAIEIEAIVDRHLGPRWQYAKICVRAQPAPVFEIDTSIGASLSFAEAEHYLRAAAEGLHEELWASGDTVLPQMKVLFTTIEAHPVDSNIAAFRAAGHLAARKLLEVSG